MDREKEKIKICIVIPGHWSDRMGGAQYQVDCLINTLRKSGQYDIYYIARNISPTFKPADYKIVNIRKPFGVLKRGYLFLDSMPILKSLYEIKPDIIYTRIGCAYTGISVYYSLRNNCKLVWHISSDADTLPARFRFRKDIISRFIDRKFFEYGIKRAAYIIAQTRTQAKQLQKSFGRDVTDVIPNFHPAPQEVIVKDKPIRIVWIANFKPVKQPEIFIQLARDMNSFSEIEFIMIGDIQGTPGWQSNIKNLISSTSNLKYLGFMPQEEVNSILARSHILVNTSKWEGFSNTFIQAWMRKVPVVSLNVNPDNILDDSKLGFYAGNYTSLKKLTAILIQDDELRSRMGEYAYQHSTKNYSMENVNRILSLFDRALKKIDM